MANEKPTASRVEPARLEPHRLSPAQRQRLQKCYEQGRRLSTQEKGPAYDDAHALFSECVIEDPGNLVYVDALLDNLERKYDRNKRGARLPGFGGARGVVKKAGMRQEWREALAAGPEALKSNPWDAPTLRTLARACEAHHYNEAELRYLKNALDANLKDVDVNRHCAESLARMGQFDQAIACWRRVEEHGKAADQEEAAARISELTIERARGRSGLPGEAHPLPPSPITTAARLAQGRTPAEAASVRQDRPAADTNSPPAPKLSARARKPDDGGDILTSTEEARSLPQGDDADDEFRRSLEKAIAANPADAGSYVLLADLWVDHRRFDEAERLLQQGLAAAGRRLAILERLEDLQVERVAHQLAIAEKRAAREGTEEARRLVADFRQELNRMELSVYRQRADRYPEDDDLKFELGVRLKRAGSYEEAVACLEQVRETSPHYASAALELGESQQHLRRFREALAHYERAAALAARDGAPEPRKKALYRAGVLATGMRQLDRAEALLRQLEEIDPRYKDLPGSGLF